MNKLYCISQQAALRSHDGGWLLAAYYEYTTSCRCDCTKHNCHPKRSNQHVCQIPKPPILIADDVDVKADDRADETSNKVCLNSLRIEDA